MLCCAAPHPAPSPPQRTPCPIPTTQPPKPIEPLNHTAKTFSPLATAAASKTENNKKLQVELADLKDDLGNALPKLKLYIVKY